MNTQTFTIKGMTCNACVKLATLALKQLPFVSDIQIDLQTGKAVIKSEQPIPFEAIQQALAEHKYTATRA